MTFVFFPRLAELEVTCVVSLFEQIWYNPPPRYKQRLPVVTAGPKDLIRIKKKKKLKRKKKVPVEHLKAKQAHQI